MGLFMDSDGIPIAFGISPGNDNEQNTLIPLEEKMIEKFDMSRFVVCTDAGLSSATNRYFNSYDKEDGRRSFITNQSIKKLKSHLKEWALDPQGWHLSGASPALHTIYGSMTASMPSAQIWKLSPKRSSR